MVDANPELSLQEKLEAIYNTSLRSKEQLRKFLLRTGRKWLVFNAIDLVDSLSWPEGVTTLQAIINCYKEQRCFENSLRGDQLDLDEIKECVQFLKVLGKEKDPSWDPK